MVNGGQGCPLPLLQPNVSLSLSVFVLCGSLRGAYIWEKLFCTTTRFLIGLDRFPLKTELTILVVITVSLYFRLLASPRKEFCKPPIFIGYLHQVAYTNG